MTDEERDETRGLAVDVARWADPMTGDLPAA